MSELNLKLKLVTPHEAVYAVTIEGSDAVSEFTVKSDEFNNLFESERFRISVHRAIEYLQAFDPEYHQALIEKVLA